MHLLIHVYQLECPLFKIIHKFVQELLIQSQFFVNLTCICRCDKINHHFRKFATFFLYSTLSFSNKSNICLSTYDVAQNAHQIK